MEALLDARQAQGTAEGNAEVIAERKDVLYELLAEVIENIALARTIQEGEGTKPVSRQARHCRVASRSRVKLEFRASFAQDLKRIRDKPLLWRVQETIKAVEAAASL